MSTITLTDRISVRVTAKDETEASNQKKRDGGNVASALGATGLTDAEKEEIGEGLGETVTGEDGKTYVKSEKIAGALKNLKTNGKLSEPSTTYRYGNVACVPLTSLGTYVVPDGYNSSYGKAGDIFYGPVGEYRLNGVDYPSYGKLRNTTVEIPKMAVVRNINTDEYYFLITNASQISKNMITKDGLPWGSGGTIPANKNQVYNGTYPRMYLPITDVGEVLSLDQYGDLHEETSGGPKIDPTGKTDEQIKRELEQAAGTNGSVQTVGNDTYIAITDPNGNPLYFLGT